MPLAPIYLKVTSPTQVRGVWFWNNRRQDGWLPTGDYVRGSKVMDICGLITILLPAPGGPKTFYMDEDTIPFECLVKH